MAAVTICSDFGCKISPKRHFQHHFTGTRTQAQRDYHSRTIIDPYSIDPLTTLELPKCPLAVSVCKADTVQAAPVQGEEEREAPGAAAPTLVPLAAITSDSCLSCYVNSGVFAQALESRY